MRRLAQNADPYIALLLGTVLLAVLLPASGDVATGLGHGTKAAVGAIFFLYGARLSTRQALEGMRHWRLQLLVLLCTFALFPLLGLATRALVPYVLTPGLQSGLLFLCLVPSTVQSSIAFTSVARGNVPAAICAGTYSSLLGIVATPLLAAWLVGGQAGLSADGLAGIVGQLLAPFVAGQLLRRWIGDFITRHRRILTLVDRGSVLLVVYTAFSQGMTQGIWGLVTPVRLLALLGVEAGLLALMLTLTWYGAHRLGFARADRVVAVFAGSNKSLAAGLPMASVLFGAHASLAVLPLMLFHQMQLVVCAFLSRRWARGTSDVRDEQDVWDAPDAGPVAAGGATGSATKATTGGGATKGATRGADGGGPSAPRMGTDVVQRQVQQ
ncbi:bile acid:sodium symporter family protein [Streptomyces marispadix]|uniref:Bile acid:sodium symporter n=1 Tax=Streptomyces marispadix TaxID=2922868 RepID=A0ABS9T4M3_9ACTN|nr:bile acid:sodium symporter family protein [Streptomyces marispadix]MCH6163455.1 bile acid:sodium symporter [Streptomyces marispadix]